MLDFRITHRLIHRWRAWPLLLTLVLALWAGPVAAIEVRSGTGASLEAGQTIDDDLAISGEEVTIAGRVNGDLFAVGNTVTILPGAQIEGNVFIGANAITVNGSVGGSLFAGGNSVTINGTVNDSVYTAGNLLQLQGQIGRNAYSGGNMVTLAPNAAVKGNLASGASRLLLQGAVTGNVTGGGESVQIAGTVGRNVRVATETLSLQPSARIGGNLSYSAPIEQAIPAGTVQGSTQFEQIEQPRRTERRPGISGFVFSLIWLAGALIVGLLLAWLFPNLYRAAQSIIERRALAAFGVGVVGVIVLPILSIVLIVTLIGLPLGLLSLGVLAAGGYIGWLLAAAALAGLLVGLLRREGRAIHVAWLVLLGLVGLYLVTAIPFLGGLVGAVVFCLGLGALLLLISERIGRPATPAAPTPPLGPALPPSAPAV